MTVGEARVDGSDGRARITADSARDYLSHVAYTEKAVRCAVLREERQDSSTDLLAN